MTAELVTLGHNRAPGDILVMTAMIRDLALSYPGRYRIRVDTPFRRDVWANNPYVEPGDRSGKFIKLDYGMYIREAGRSKIHFLTAFHRNFEKQTGVRVPLHRPYPDLHLTEDEPRRVPGRYWVMMAGGKSDFTTKHWSFARYREVADALAGFGLTVVQAGGAQSNHKHPRVPGAVDLVGKTSIRELFHLIKHADGVVCPITMAMHAAAALGRPAVVVAGGREEWWWEGYHRTNPGLGTVAGTLPVDHRYLHTLGMLPCCASRGSWANKVEKKVGDRSVCHDSLDSDENQRLPRCMHMITTEMVLAAVVSYYLDGTLPPLGRLSALNASSSKPSTTLSSTEKTKADCPSGVENANPTTTENGERKTWPS